MKRLLSLALILSLLLCGCGGNTALEQPVDFYYPRASLSYGSSDSIFESEQAEGSGYENDLPGLLNVYLQGPKSSTLRSPFPYGVKVIEISQSEGVARLTLSDELAQLTGVELTLACASLSLTCLKLTDAEAVVIRAETMLLNNEESIVMSADSILTLDAPVDAYTEETTQ